MGQLILLLILFFVFLGAFSRLLELALEHKRFAIFLVVFAYLAGSIWVVLLILLFHRVYQNPQVKWQVDAYREKPKRWWENKKVLYRSIKNYKEESKDRIRLKHDGEIFFLCYKVFSPILDTQENQALKALKKEILEKETLLSDLQKEKMIPSQPVKVKCPKCRYSKVITFTSDVISPELLLDHCPKCQAKLECVPLNIINKIFTSLLK